VHLHNALASILESLDDAALLPDRKALA